MFKKPAAPQPWPIADNRAVAGSTFSVLGADLVIKGDLAASADLHIDGRVEGDITCAALVQGESSEILGAVAVERARLAGTVRGTIAARELVILKTARIEGDVHYDSLTIEQGAEVTGRFAPRAATIAVANDDAEATLTLATSNG